MKAFEDYSHDADTGAEPTLPVPTDPTTGDESLPMERNRISHPSSRLWAELCDTRYQMLIGELWLAILLPQDAPTDLRSQLFRKSLFTEMKRGVGAIARKLATLPRHASSERRIHSAGAPFRGTPIAELPTDVAGWKQYLRDRVATTAQLRTRLESPENTIPLVPTDRTSILNPLQTSDTQLLSLLGS